MSRQRRHCVRPRPSLKRQSFFFISFSFCIKEKRNFKSEGIREATAELDNGEPFSLYIHNNNNNNNKKRDRTRS